MNVILIGYRGTGKSAVADLIASDLGLLVVSLDTEIVRKAGKSIPEVVEEVGWPGFRNLETEVVCEFAAKDDQVIDCGGGVVEREANYEPLREAGSVVWLKASTETIVDRIKGDENRPSLTGTKSFTDEVSEVLERRTPLYRKLAHIEVDTDGKTIGEVADEVRKHVNS